MAIQKDDDKELKAILDKNMDQAWDSLHYLQVSVKCVHW
jgi:hypothetical protein